MRQLLPLVVVLAILAACSGEAPAPRIEAETPSIEPAPLDPNAFKVEQAALASCGAVTAEGYCGVTFGMAPTAAQQKFPVKLSVYAGGDPDSASDLNRCYEFFAAEPVQVSFLVEKNQVGRVDILSEVPKTVDGFGVGTEGQAIRAKYGAALAEQPNKYEPEITELILQQGAAKFIFEIQDGKVRSWRAGIPPTIDYVEHCG